MCKLIPFLFLLLLATFSQFIAANNQALELDKLVSQWTQIEQQHSEIENRWRENKPLLEQQLQLLQKERIQLQGILDQHVTANNEVEKERFSLLQQQTQMEEIQQLMALELTAISSVVINMHNQLPPPLKKQWDADVTLLSGGATDFRNLDTATENNALNQPTSLLNNSEKLDKLLNLLNQISQFEQRVALHQTTMQVSGEAGKTIEIEVDQVYLGISQGWYISKNGQYWGTGNSHAKGWSWQHQTANVNVSELRQTVQMLTEPATAALVTLPITLSKNISSNSLDFNNSTSNSQSSNVLGSSALESSDNQSISMESAK